MPLQQAERQIRINPPPGPDKLQVYGIDLTEELGRLFECRADLLSEDVGTTYSITAGDELSISESEASLVMKSGGTILINGKKIESTGYDCINFTSPSINNN